MTTTDAASDLLSRVRSGAWLDAQDFPPLTWAVPGLVPEGFGLLTGAPKAGKSWLALGLALAVSAGTPALGKVPTGDARRVLLLALEDGPRRLQHRARALLGEQAIPERLDVITQARQDEVAPLIGAWLDREDGEGALVILDTLGKVLPPTMAGESAYSRDYRTGGDLKALADAHGAALLAVHHTRKAEAADWMDSTSGTNGLNGAADFTVNLSRSRNEAGGVLRVTGRDVLENEYAVTVRDGCWIVDGDSLNEAARAAEAARATAGLGDRSAEVVAEVRRHPEGIGPTALGEALGMQANHAGTYLSRLAEAGRIGKRGRGLYTPVETVESVETGRPDSTFSTLSTPSEEASDSTLSTLSTPL